MTDQLERLTTALAERYAVEGELGAGGMATVYLASDLKHQRRVAIKVLRPELAAALGAERFVHEIEITANLQHPHILPLFDSGEADGFLYYVMPFVQGESLRDLLHREGALPVAKAIDLVRDVAAALSHAHEQGIVHRDIKPENILLVDGEAMVADFGIALAVSTADSTRLTATGLSVGTPSYMSPEQIDGRSTVDHRSDIYALGCLLYETLTGTPPFTGPTAQAVIASSMVDEAPSAHKVRTEVPTAMDAVISRALAKDPDDRFAGAREFADALTLPSGPAPVRPWAKAGLAVLVLVVVGLGFTLWRGKRMAAARAGLADIRNLVTQGDYALAYQRAVSAEAVLSQDSTLTVLLAEVSDTLNVSTDPAGADVVVAPFNSDGTVGEAVYTGTTPVRDLRIARVDHLVTATLVGYQVTHRLADSRLYRDSLRFWGENTPVSGQIDLDIAMTADAEDTRDMALVPGGLYQLVGPDAPPNTAATLGDFLIDKYEVTNQAYRSFVLSGAYAEDRLWAEVPPSVRATLTDRTGLPGPRDWSGQAFPEGRDRHPVAGVTWYEANAYCMAQGKRLPTIFEWEKADRDGVIAPMGVIMPWGFLNSSTSIGARANFDSEGTVPVDAHPSGISRYGVYAMAGNVKEWLLNPMAGGHVVTGGSYEDPSYLYPQFGGQNDAFAAPTLGFRCARSVDGEVGDAARAMDVNARTPEYNPVSRATFESFRSFYDYDRQPANPRGRTTHETDGWTRERMWIDGIGGDSILLYFYAPSQASPPYQTLVFVPGTSSFCCMTTAEDIEFRIGPLIQGGRAAVVVAMHGMRERPFPPGFTPPATNSVRFRDLMVRHATELRLGVDYVVGRDDVDTERIAYVGSSWGAGSRLGFAALDDRFRVFILLAAGIDERVKPTLPEADNVNFAPYIDGPKLVVNGRNDEEHTWLARALPLWNLLSEPKELVLIDGAGHIPPVEDRIPPMVEFLDRTLGPVGGR